MPRWGLKLAGRLRPGWVSVVFKLWLWLQGLEAAGSDRWDRVAFSAAAGAGRRRAQQTEGVRSASASARRRCRWTELRDRGGDGEARGEDGHPE